MADHPYRTGVVCDHPPSAREDHGPYHRDERCSLCGAVRAESDPSWDDGSPKPHRRR